ncbi:MAG: ROK family protein [Phycisphaerae bacterium]
MGRKKADRLILGWDVGGTKSAAVVGTSAGAIVDRVEYPSNSAAKGSRGMIDEFVGHAKAMLKRHEGIAAVGVSIGGPLNAAKGLVIAPPHLPGWNNVPLADILREELGLAVVIEHDAAACLLAEWLWGAARGMTHAAYLTCGTGIGAGLMIDGRIVRGPDGQSPEVGHIRLAEDGPDMFGKPGCVESFCGGEGMSKLAHWMFPSRFALPTDARVLDKLSREGDVDARAVLAEAARRTGQLCAILADTFAPQVIVLGSLARYFEQWWIEAIREEFAREALPENARHARIVPAALGKDLQDLSAIAPCCT